MQMRQALVFVRENALRIFLVSTLVLVPCFWHKSIEAGDIPSHTYNAWLALLIKQGNAPGLYVESRWNNILVDWSLEKVGAVLGFVVAERVIVVISVLIFFWGAFALIGAANRRPPWYLVPALAMITYGWTFYSGFLNFYLSLGLAFLAVVLIWRGNNGDWLLAAVLAVLVLMAQPLGFICLIGLAAYFRLENFLLDPQPKLLFRDGQPVPLAPKAVETLLSLVENGGRLVTKEDLMQAPSSVSKRPGELGTKRSAEETRQPREKPYGT